MRESHRGFKFARDLKQCALANGINERKWRERRIEVANSTDKSKNSFSKGSELVSDKIAFSRRSPVDKFITVDMVKMLFLFFSFFYNKRNFYFSFFFFYWTKNLKKAICDILLTALDVFGRFSPLSIVIY